ncbi:hypothetical protein HQ545_01370 [Candidatus Woesearchaeota archaeon]|nr:hypothetical protein [Candidatus Woesearchaeota archaeon]
MGVVRIDDALDKQIERFLKKPENKYKYPSKTAFLNIMIHENLMKEVKK